MFSSTLVEGRGTESPPSANSPELRQGDNRRP
jgi:hypothetical protein